MASTSNRDYSILEIVCVAWMLVFTASCLLLIPELYRGVRGNENVFGHPAPPPPTVLELAGGSQPPSVTQIAKIIGEHVVARRCVSGAVFVVLIAAPFVFSFRLRAWVNVVILCGNLALLLVEILGVLAMLARPY